MIDSITKEPIQVRRYPEAWPYIRLPLDQLEQVKKILDGAGYRYHVPKYALSVNGEPYTVVVSLEHRADVAALQKLLDDHQDPEMVSSRS
jgi:hypothetical protein